MINSQDSSNFPETENMLKIKERKLQSFKDEKLKILEFEATKLNQLNSLFDSLMIKYEKLKIKHMETRKNLKLTITENARFKSVSQYLIKNFEELTGCVVRGCSETTDCIKDDAISLQVTKYSRN